MSSKTLQHVYDTLPSSTSIRLLKVFSNGPIYGELETHTLESAPPFTALSYTWGCPFSEPNYELEDVQDTAAVNRQYTNERDVPISCGDTYVLVTRNAKEALDALRNRYGHLEVMFSDTSYLWLDSVCINQEDVAERAAQVKIMDQIYAKATRVFIWLGPALARTSRAVELVTYLGSIDAESYSLTKPHDLRSTWKTYDALGMPEITLEDWAVVTSFIQRPWFMRAWVVQEYCLPRYTTVLCGEERLPWMNLYATSMLLKYTDWCHQLHGLDNFTAWRNALQEYAEADSSDDVENKESHKQAALDKIERLEKNRAAWSIDFPPGLGPFILMEMRKELWSTEDIEMGSLLRGVAMCKGKRATDLRDKVYALLEPINKILRRCPATGPIEPSYDAANTVAKVFADFSYRAIVADDKLHVLGLVSDLAFREVEDLPSWCLDLSRSSYPAKPAWQDWPDEESLAKLDSLYETPSSTDCRTLCVRGIFLHRVSHRAIPYEPLNELQVIEWLNLANVIQSEHYPDTDPVEVLWRTLLTNDVPEESSDHPDVGRSFVFYLFVLLLSPRSASVRLGIEPVSDERWERYETAVEQMVALKQAYPTCKLLSREEYGTTISPMHSDDAEIRRAAVDSVHGQGFQFEDHVREWGFARRLFVSGGYLGHGPQSLNIDDELWYLPKTMAPILLRRQPNGHYMVIGSAYVHGLTATSVLLQAAKMQDVILE